jgi:hypothetical protein
VLRAVISVEDLDQPTVVQLRRGARRRHNLAEAAESGHEGAHGDRTGKGSIGRPPQRRSAFIAELLVEPVPVGQAPRITLRPRITAARPGRFGGRCGSSGGGFGGFGCRFGS